MLLYKNLWMLP